MVVTNSCGSVTSYLAWLSISDPVPPSVSSWPTNQRIAANASCQAQVPDLTSQVSASDNCGAVTIWQQPEAGTWVGLGQTLVTVSVYDQAGSPQADRPTVNALPPPDRAGHQSNAGGRPDLHHQPAGPASRNHRFRQLQFVDGDAKPATGQRAWPGANARDVQRQGCGG